MPNRSTTGTKSFTAPSLAVKAAVTAWSQPFALGPALREGVGPLSEWRKERAWRLALDASKQPFETGCADDCCHPSHGHRQ